MGVIGSAPPSGGGTESVRYAQLYESGDFRRLRARHLGLTLVLTGAFSGWYLLYVLMSAFARDIMARPVIGAVNVALVFGVLQILTAFGLAWGYSGYTRRVLDPLAERIRSQAVSGPAQVRDAPPVSEAPPRPRYHEDGPPEGFYTDPFDGWTRTAGGAR